MSAVRSLTGVDRTWPEGLHRKRLTYFGLRVLCTMWGRRQFSLTTRSQSARLQASVDVSFGDTMRRRQFITGLATAMLWPIAARTQQPERMKRIGVLMGVADDAEGQARLTA